MVPLPRVCVIGAGSSGIAVLKALTERGLPHLCFEKGERIGGNWCYANSNGMSAAYESLHINTDCRLMEYRDSRRYRDGSPRHTMQVDFGAYLHRLGRHARRGAQGVRPGRNLPSSRTAPGVG